MIDLSVILLLMTLRGPGDGPQAPPATLQDPDRPSVSAAEIKALRDNNVFAPRSATKRPPRGPKPGGGRSEGVVSKPRPPVATGIYFDVQSKSCRLVIEDRNEAGLKQFKEPKILKVGDEWNGLKVESVTLDQAAYTLGGVSRGIRVGESLPEGEWKSAASEDAFSDDGDLPISGDRTVPSSGKSEVKPQTPEERDQILETLKRKNGKKARVVDRE